MTSRVSRHVLLGLTLSFACLAQTWEVGAAGGYGLYHNLTAKSTAGSAKVGFSSGPALSVVGTENMTEHIGGEVRYIYNSGDLKIDGNESAKMGGESHAFSYEFLFYGAPKEAAVRPFFAAGAGGKWYRGTGPEVSFQPLNRIAVLTRSSEWEPMVSFGGGLKFITGKHMVLRLDVRDQTTPFPTKVITPTPPTGKVNGWLHDFIVLAGVGFTF